MFGKIADKIRNGLWPTQVVPTTQLSATALANATATGALPITGDLLVVTTSTTTNNSAQLPVPTTVGDTVFIRNADSADAVNVFPATGGTINALSANASFSVAANKNALFVAVGANAWAVVLSA